MQACRLRSHTVVVPPPQAGNGGNGRNGGNGGTAERMAEWQKLEWSNGENGGNGGMAKRMAEWQNGRKWIQNDTYVLFMVHADIDDDTLILYV
jgi:hypothetical protein